jgi:filamentous hemagglutinin
MDQVKTDQHGDASAKQYDKRAADNQTVIGSSVSAGGALQLAAGIKETAALTVSSSALASTGALSLSATGDVLIGGVQENHVIDNASHHESRSVFTKSSGSSIDYSASSTLVGSSVGGGTVSVKSGNDIVVTGSAINAQKDLTLVAGRDIVVTSGLQSIDENHSAESKKSGFSLKPAGFGYSKAEQQQNGASSTTTQLGSTISGGTVTAVAGRDLSVIASNVVADGAVVLAGTRDVNIVSAQNTTDSTSASSSKKSGSIGSGWQPAIGTVKTTEQGTSQSVTQAGSQVASLGGNVTIEAGERYTQTASNVIAPGGNIAIIAKDVQITAGYDTASSDSQSTFSKTAVGMSVSIPIVSTVQGIASLASAAKQAGSDRMTALAAVTAGMQVKDAYNNVTAAGDPAGIKIGVSLGTSKSESSTTQSSSTAVGSQVKAGGDVTIVATGGGAGSNITSIGSDISGGGNVTLVADNKINILAAENTSSQHSSNSSSGASIGVTYSMGGAQNGFSLELAANRANGKADGESTTYANSHVSAGNTVNLQSGGDTNIKGGVVSAVNVVANIGGDLNVQSLQDKVVYDSKQKSAGVSVSVCIPPACYGASTVSGSLSRAAVNGDFLSVGEQSGIKAGDGGFQLVVHGNTDLIGGVISSSQAAIDQGKNSLATGSLTYTELKNKDVYEASSFAMSGSVSGKFGDQGKAVSSADKLAAGGKAAPSATGGFGQDSGNQSSTTASAISAGALTITDEAKQAATGKTVEQALAGIATGVTDTAAAQAGALTQAWNGEALMKEVQAQTQITQAFSAQAPRAIADFASRQEKLIEDELKNDPTNVDLKADLAKWGEGGSYRVALHTVSGALSGGIGGALGSATVASSAQLLTDIQFKAEVTLVESGMAPATARILAQGVAEATSIAVGTIVGGAAGASTSLTTDTNNRQESIAEISLIKKLAEGKAKQMCAGNSDCIVRMTLTWADALEKVSKGNIDSADAAKNMVYLTKLANASKDPNSEGARGELLGYLNTLSTAQSILAPYTGLPVLVNGKSFTVNGSPLTYFGATQAQRDDPYSNESLGGIPDPVFPNVASRDGIRLENFAALNGSATPVYPVEHLLLGGAVTDRVVGTLGKYFTSLDVGLAGTVGTSAGGNISAQKLTTEGMALGLSSAEKGLAVQLEGIGSNQVAGDLREFVADSYFMRNGFTRLEGKCGANCFDGIYLKDGKVYINEVKPIGSNNSISLSPANPNTGLPAQMSDSWIDSAVSRLATSADPAARKTATIIQDAIDRGVVIKLVTGVNSKGATVIKIN